MGDVSEIDIDAALLRFVYGAVHFGWDLHIASGDAPADVAAALVDRGLAYEEEGLMLLTIGGRQRRDRAGKLRDVVAMVREAQPSSGAAILRGSDADGMWKITVELTPIAKNGGAP